MDKIFVCVGCGIAAIVFLGVAVVYCFRYFTDKKNDLRMMYMGRLIRAMKTRAILAAVGFAASIAAALITYFFF